MGTYLLDLLNLEHWTAVARVRMSAHKLAIETRRHVKPKYKLDEVEDGLHFLSNCQGRI